jgi:hypothetical protein
VLGEGGRLLVGQVERHPGEDGDGGCDGKYRLRCVFPRIRWRIFVGDGRDNVTPIRYPGRPDTLGLISNLLRYMVPWSESN